MRFARRSPVLFGFIVGALLRNASLQFMARAYDSGDVHLFHTWTTIALVARVILYTCLTIGLIQLLIPSQRAYYSAFLREHPFVSVWLISTAANAAVWIAIRPLPLDARIEIDRISSWSLLVLFGVGLVLVGWSRRHNATPRAHDAHDSP